MTRPRFGELEISEDPSFQRREWRAQVIGVCLLGAFLVAGLAGVLGPGALSDGHSGAGALEVDYLRYPRYLKPHTLSVEAPSQGGDELRLWIEERYLDAFFVQDVRPQPASVEAAGDRVIYVFDMAPGSDTVPVTFDLRSHRTGVATGRIGVDGGESVVFRQVLYP